MKKFIRKLLPGILDHLSDKIEIAINDEKETKLDKIVIWLISEPVKKSIDRFYEVYSKMVVKIHEGK